MHRQRRRRADCECRRPVSIRAWTRPIPCPVTPRAFWNWRHYDAIEVPLLCLRGENSDLVLKETTDEMLRRGPGAMGLAQVVEVAGCGHAPALNVPDHLDRVSVFIDGLR